MALDREAWEDNTEYGSEGQVRTAYLGSSLQLIPSGKYYMPWACSNLAPCPICGGKGHLRRRQSLRKQKKAYARITHWTRAIKRNPHAYKHKRGYGKKGYAWFHDRAAGTVPCARCGTYGSAEAWDDEAYWEKLEAEADERGLSIINGEGDPTDVFVAEYRDSPEEDSDECDTDS